MKKFLVVFSIVLMSCGKKTEENPESSYKPILMKREDLEKSVTYSAVARPLKKLGKIYTIGQYIFMVDKFQGVHVINNSDPAHPSVSGFIKVPGCVDIAAKGNYLYVDNATDLVTINVSNPAAPVVVDRDRDVFPDIIPPDYTTLPDVYSKENRPKNTVIVRWE